MNELPDLALYRLFDHLNLADRQSCRLVNKRFLLLIDSLPSKVLGIYLIDPEARFRAPRWFDDFQAINPRNLVLITTAFQLTRLNLLTSPYCHNLKKLHLDFSLFCFTNGKPFHFDLHILSSFTQLKTLRIELPSRLWELFEYDCTEPVVLKSLVNLFVDVPNRYEATEADRLKLDCENLNFLQLREQIRKQPFDDSIHLMHPEQVKHLRISSGHFEYNVQFLNTFKCIRELDCRMSDPEEITTLIRLIDGYQELQMLSVQFVKSFGKVFDLEAIEQLRTHLRTTRPALVVYLNGLRMELFDQLKLLPQEARLDSQLDFYLQNYQSTSKHLSQFTVLSYSRWESFELRKQMPSGFLRKLVNLCKIEVNGRVEDPNTFADLLSKCELIWFLKLTNSSLDQAFYSSLSHSAPYLEELCIVDDPKLVESLDLSFLLELRHLVVLDVNRSLDLDLAYRLFMNNFSTNRLEFLINGRRSQLLRFSFGEYLQSRPLVDDENLKSLAGKLAEDYNRKYETRLTVHQYLVPKKFAFYYRDTQ